MTELSYLSLFVRAIAKVLLVTGVGPGGALALIAECCGFRVVALGIEKVSVAKFRGRAVSQANDLRPTPLNRATSSPRKIRRYA